MLLCWHTLAVVTLLTRKPSAIGLIEFTVKTGRTASLTPQAPSGGHTMAYLCLWSECTQLRLLPRTSVHLKAPRWCCKALCRYCRDKQAERERNSPCLWCVADRKKKMCLVAQFWWWAKKCPQIEDLGLQCGASKHFHKHFCIRWLPCK